MLKKRQNPYYITSTRSFREVLNNAELITCMKFQKKIYGQKTSKILPEWFFLICDPKDFSKIELCHFCILIVP